MALKSSVSSRFCTDLYSERVAVDAPRVAQAITAICQSSEKVNGGQIYFIRPDDSDYVKIGFTEKMTPAMRLATLQVAWPVELRIW